MQSYAKKVSYSTLVLMFSLLGACRQDTVGFGFAINHVAVNPGYQVLEIHVDQTLNLSQQARAALQNGVPLTLRLEMELRSNEDLIANKHVARNFQIRYLPLSERFQLSVDIPPGQETFSRLRYVLATMDALDVQLPSGPLPPGNYELRTRVQLDESRLPAPMQLPALFSPQWRHDSDWSVWPFKVTV